MIEQHLASGAKEIDRAPYDSFNNELGIDVELLAYVAQSAKLGKQGEDEGIENDQV
ncbi:MAG: hypothetical protein ACKO7P_07175 [Bacteroidota bacterium]